MPPPKKDKRTLPDAYKALLHSPQEAGDKRLTWAKMMKDAPGVQWGIGSVDDRIIPAHPGDFVAIVGRPAQGKTSLLAWLAKQEANAIRARNTHHREAVIYVTWEQVIEEIDSLFYADADYSATDIVRGTVDLDKIELDALKRANVPIWLIGISSTGHDPTQVLPRMTLDVIWRLCDSMEAEYGRKPTLICADYLQLIPVEHAKDMVSSVTFASGMLKELAMRCACPIFAGVQARQEVDTYKEPIPTSRDGQWASRIYQACDKWFSIVRPWLYDVWRKKGKISLGGRQYDVEENLFALFKLKERFNKGRDVFPLFFEMEYLRLEEVAAQQIPLNF